MKKQVTVTIDEELNERWNKIAKLHKLSKSNMVEEYIMNILPILEESTPNKMMAQAMKKMAASIDDTANLFDK